MGTRIPDRWLNYKAVGNIVDGTRFVAFKVPLKKQFTENAKKDVRFDGQMLLEKMPNLGIIIDLTNTNRYYDPRFFEDEGVEHQKLMIPGHVTPPQRLVNRFKDYVKEFLQKNSDNNKLIGVHCTHGVNRTGFLICNYMVSEMAVNPNEAIDKFAEARGHKIERNNYLDALQKLTATEEDNSKSPAEGEPTSQDEHPAHNNARQRVHSNERSTRNWRTNERKRCASPPNQDRRNSYSWRNPDNYNGNDERPPSPKRRYTPNLVNRRSNFEYSQQCRRQAYDFPKMEFRGRGESTNDNSRHTSNRSLDHHQRSRPPIDNSYRPRELSAHRGGPPQNGNSSQAHHHHYQHRSDQRYRKDNRDSSWRPSSPSSSTRGHHSDNSYRNRR